ncbi:GlsB/YeaQ/YmgE family stress response membrane protein [Amycolatopsis sp. YIM 10]|uniref:GlsB/YeaQ/YmgE family stress response membrane protein n=1 Tax=Amycolatopsis sp. YIM 10 TaxID=2653857 RepID=UPI0012A88688|nr:GlsB/YeaQ/YmgE family stress response membrane protein [Amycolatopsis sp. YIM 10]QFU91705.1 hypothetical protein YIM_32720 [Amycolatopsis sp. YIM 10]
MSIAWIVLGGWAASTLFQIDTTGGFFDLSTWIIAILGAAVLLLVYYAVTSGSRRSGFWRASR